MKNVARRTHSTDFSRAPHISLPAVAPLAESRAAALVFAADRFLARPEIAACVTNGSNGYSANLPAALEQRMVLWQSWPDMDRCLSFSRALDHALAESAPPDEVAMAVAAAIRAFPTGDRAASGYAEGVTAFLVEEAEVRGWSMAAVAGGLLTVIRSSRFMPSAAEIIEAVGVAHRHLRHAAWAAKTAADLAFEIKWSLIDAGMIEDDAGEGF